ncbi:MAG: hypothetical protein H6884_09840 [Rhodobiaceae bacterium]|nr:hypothetical protein [Alphaproteobacteria bacterium]MCB1473845.1 hypothetical protein [Rhodobiaceae bacterium]MCC0054348.1 hypothetical protein [Rhodobiaceae bacterium]
MKRLIWFAQMTNKKSPRPSPPASKQELPFYEIMARAAADNHLAVLEFTKSYGQATLRGLFVANGSALIALLAFLGTVFSQKADVGVLLAQQIGEPAYRFLEGLFFAIFSTASSYMSGFVSAGCIPRPIDVMDHAVFGRPYRDDHSAYVWWAVFTALCYLAAIISAVCFLLGGGDLLDALSSIDVSKG